MSHLSSYHPSPNERIKYFGSGTQDGHGGRSAEHRAEMEQIAQKKIAEMIPEIQRTAYISAYNDIVNALSFDVTTAVSIAFANGAQIFYDSKTQKVIADAVMREVRKGLSQFK